MNARRRLLGLLLPPTAWLALFVLVPTAVVAGAAFSQEGWQFLAHADTWALLGRSFGVAALSTGLCLAVSYPVAYYIAGCPPGRRNLLLFLVVFPFWTNLLVRTYALMFVLRPLGILYTPAAGVIGLVHSFLPFMILPLYASIEKLPRKLLEASQDLGASPWRTFWSVTIPLTMPGIGAGCILVFIPAVGIFALPELLCGERLTLVGNLINILFKDNPRSPAGAALTLVLMVSTLTLTWVYHRIRKTEGLV
jgi:spermidine/putrescine transport system permease protein